MATALLGAAFAVLAVLVGLGQLDAVDSFALRHLMRGGLPTDSPIPVIGHLLQYHGHHFDATQVVRLPGTIVLSIVVMLALCAVMGRRGEPGSVLGWAAAFGIANLVVVLCKEMLTKPPLYALEDGRKELVAGFTSSYPSGHAARIVVLAGLCVYLWPRVGWLFVLWAIASVVALEVDRIHTPSDLAGGVLLGAALVAVAPLAGLAAGVLLGRLGTAGCVGATD